jgi:hypothetical protein
MLKRQSSFVRRLLKDDVVRGMLCIGASLGSALATQRWAQESAVWLIVGAVIALALAAVGAFLLMRDRIRMYRR